jgi:lactoylglutathione lyase
MTKYTWEHIHLRSADPTATGPSPQTPYMGLEHIGLTVENIDAAVAELKGKGVPFTMEPKTIRPGVRIAFLTAPQNVSIELIQRG